MNTNRRRLAAFLVVPLLAAAAGCASDPADAKKEATEEYIFVTVTGSNIPKRIKKSDIENGTLPKDGDMQVIDKEQFRKSLGPGRKLERGS